MLDGFVIEESRVKPLANSSNESKIAVLKKRYTSFLASVCVHVFIVVILFYVADKQKVKHEPMVGKVIKSFLYQKPAKTKVLEQENKPETKEFIQDKTPEVLAPIPREIEKPEIEKTISHNKSTATISNNNALPERKTGFSPVKQLESLRNSINKQIIEQSVSKHQQFKSASKMHGAQDLVPHSKKQLTYEQQREKNTTKMSDNISITKYDNGVCTIKREQFLGSPVEGSSSVFACGESKFDKSFREHMKKVNAKLINKNR